MADFILKTDQSHRFGQTRNILGYIVSFNSEGLASVSEETYTGILNNLKEEDEIGVYPFNAEIKPKKETPIINIGSSEVNTLRAEIVKLTSELNDKENTIKDLTTKLENFFKIEEEVNINTEGMSVEDLRDICRKMEYPENEWIGRKNVNSLKKYLAEKEVKN